jgi:hypothetical protein
MTATCQWIAGEPSADEACKCGQPTVSPMEPYCATHHARAWRQRRPDGSGWLPERAAPVAKMPPRLDRQARATLGHARRPVRVDLVVLRDGLAAGRSIADLAAEFGVGVDHLRSVITGKLGMTLKKPPTAARRIKRLLRRGGMTHAAIAEAVGCDRTRIGQVAKTMGRGR